MPQQNERLSGKSFLPPWVWHEHLARFAFCAGFVAGKSVIDCACGDGTGAEMFVRAGAQSVRAFDLCADAVATARARSRAANLDFQVADATDLPVPAQSADVYVSFETIEHLEDDAAFLAGVRRVLKPDGLFICSTPNRTVTNPGKSLGDKPWNQFHVREYGLEEYLALLGTRFRSVALYGQNPKRSSVVQAMGRLGRVLPGHGAVRLNQVFKLPAFLFDRYENHLVRPREPGRDCEYLVAVCSQPC